MDKNNVKDVPYIVHESELARLERIIKRMFILLIILIFSLFASNLAWLYVWNQYDYESVETQTIKAKQDGKGVNIIGGEDITYGSNGNNNKKKDTPKNKKER